MSLRARVLTAVMVIAIVLVGVAVVVTRSMRADLVSRVDAQLENAAGQVAGSVDVSRGPVRVTPPAGDPRGGLTTVHAWVITRGGVGQILSDPGGDGDAAEPPGPDLTVEQALQRIDDGPFTTGALDGSSTRFRVTVESVGAGRAAVVVASPLDEVDASVSQLVRLQAIVTIAVLAILALIAWWVIRLGIRPVKQMTEAAASIGEGDLSRRVPTGADGTEAGELGSALNRMLEQIEHSFDARARSEEQLRQFVADASHELRTPVATVRGYAELYRTGGLSDAERLDDAMRRTETEATRMGQLVDDLLLLARLDQGRPLATAPVHLDDVVTDVVEGARVRAPDRSITLGPADEATIIGDAGRLHQAVSNLVANALVHTPETTAVTVSVTATDEHALVAVTDEGPGMTPEVADRIFERFYRVDAARSRSAGGSGLGLAIVDATVRAHGGTVSVTTSPADGSTFTVTLPRSLPPPAEPLPDGSSTER